MLTRDNRTDIIETFPVTQIATLIIDTVVVARLPTLSKPW